jgi:hypothetical protein
MTSTSRSKRARLYLYSDAKQFERRGLVSFLHSMSRAAVEVRALRDAEGSGALEEYFCVAVSCTGMITGPPKAALVRFKFPLLQKNAWIYTVEDSQGLAA